MKREKPPALDRRTARPLVAYKRPERAAEPYVDGFSRALGLKPTTTLFGARKVKI